MYSLCFILQNHILYVVRTIFCQQRTSVCSCLHGHGPPDICLCLLHWAVAILWWWRGLKSLFACWRWFFFVLCMLLSSLTIFFLYFSVSLRQQEKYSYMSLLLKRKLNHILVELVHLTNIFTFLSTVCNKSDIYINRESLFLHANVSL